MAIKHLDKNLNRSLQENQQRSLSIYSNSSVSGIDAIDMYADNGSTGLPCTGTLLGMRQNLWTNITCGAGQQKYMQIGLSFDGEFHR